MTRLLVVGAGGIGCELLKVLIREGFADLAVVDLDTIDFSNLNRQFFFRKEHVGKPKALCAAAALRDSDPSVKIEALHDNMMDAKFGVEFFRGFKVVLNALDNLKARSHVNRMCIAAGVPLIDAGSTGYNGQVFPIIPRMTACYDCQPKPRDNKSYAVCTIRSTPEKPEHCIAWGKFLFSLLFGPTDEDNLLSDMKHVKAELKSDDAPAALMSLFNLIFRRAVEEHAEMPGAWDGKVKPIACPLVAIDASLTLPEPTETPAVEAAAQLFFRSGSRILCSRDVGNLAFDKDDVDAMDFVSAVSNLRMFSYHIPRISRWEAQAIAGKIIPAIASTNAVVAGLQVAQLKRVLAFQASGATDPLTSDIRFSWVKQIPSGRFIVLPDKLEPPSAACASCQGAAIEVTLNDFSSWHMQDFVKRVLQDHLSLLEPLVESSTDAVCLFDPEMLHDEDDRSQLRNPLSFWDLTSGVVLMLTDIQQGFQCTMTLLEENDMKEEEGYRVVRTRSKAAEEPTATTAADDSESSDLELCESDDVEIVADKVESKKRESDQQHEPPAKRAKVHTACSPACVAASTANATTSVALE